VAQIVVVVTIFGNPYRIPYTAIYVLYNTVLYGIRPVFPSDLAWYGTCTDHIRTAIFHAIRYGCGALVPDHGSMRLL
jgi:hypothetical protein